MACPGTLIGLASARVVAVASESVCGRSPPQRITRVATPDPAPNVARAHPAPVRTILAVVLAGLALGLACVAVHASAPQPPQQQQITPIQQNAPPAGGTQTVVTPATSHPPAGVEIRLTDAAALASMVTAVVAIWLAASARRKVNGVERRLP